MYLIGIVLRQRGVTLVRRLDGEIVPKPPWGRYGAGIALFVPNTVYTLW